MKRDERTAKHWRRDAARPQPDGRAQPAAPPYSYGSRDVQPGYESTWRGDEPVIERDPWSDSD